jgi:hypothetical protein
MDTHLGACRQTRTRCGVGNGVLPGVEVEGDNEIVGHPTTSAPRRLSPSASILLTDEPWFTCQLCLIYGAAWWAHYPQIWVAPDQGIAGDRLGPRDQVPEIKNSNSRRMEELTYFIDQQHFRTSCCLEAPTKNCTPFY